MIFPEIVGGFFFWLRGSAVFEQLTGRGKTTADAVWAFALTLLALAFGLWGWILLALFVGLWLGGRPPWWRTLTLGRNPNDSHLSVLDQWFLHAMRGILWTLPAGLALAAFGNWWGLAFALSGILAPIFWELGWRTYPARATEIGEATFGAWIGFALIACI